MKKNRESNFELLRIFAMILIITYHITLHCIVPQLGENPLFNTPYISKKILLLNFFMSAGKIGNGIFILISGYFLANKPKIDILAVIKKIVPQLVFANCLLTVVSFGYNRLINHNALNLVDMSEINESWWFVGYYLMIVIIGSLFLNRFIVSLSQQRKKAFLAILFVFCSLSWSSSIFANISGGLRVLIAGIFLYVLGGYIRSYNPFGKVKTRAVGGFVFLLYVFIFLSGYNIDASGISKYHVTNADTYSHLFFGGTDYSFLVLLISISLFEIGRRSHIGNSKVINYLGSSTFMIYLFHDISFIHMKWRHFDWISAYYYRPFVFALMMLLWIVLTFLVGVVSYAIYQLIGRIMMSQSFQSLVIKDQRYD